MLHFILINLLAHYWLLLVVRSHLLYCQASVVTILWLDVVCSTILSFKTDLYYSFRHRCSDDTAMIDVCEDCRVFWHFFVRYNGR